MTETRGGIISCQFLVFGTTSDFLVGVLLVLKFMMTLCGEEKKRISFRNPEAVSQFFSSDVTS